MLLDNPYTADPAAGLRAQLFYGEEVRADVQVELFARTPGGAPERSRCTAPTRRAS